MIKKTDKTVFVVVGENKLIDVTGAVGVGFTRDAAEQIKKDTEWCCDRQEIIECHLWEENGLPL